MEEKLDLYDILVVVLLIIDFLGLLLLIRTQRDIQNFNERQNVINEYILNRIGG